MLINEQLFEVLLEMDASHRDDRDGGMGLVLSIMKYADRLNQDSRSAF